MSQEKLYIQLPREYNQCPRCGSDWAEHYYKPTKLNRPLPKREDEICLKCGMKYYYGEHGPKMLSLPSFLRKDYYLVWYIVNKECSYGSIYDAIDGTTITLPWQPFDITPDKLTKLKTYLTFK